MTTLILGAGLAGLSAAYHGDPSWRLLEAASRPGGECATDQIQGFSLDRAGHLLHLRNPKIRAWVEKLLPGQWCLIQRDARIRLMNHDLRYPFQANLFALDPVLKSRALMDYLIAVTQPHPRPRTFLAWAKQSFGETMAQLFFEPYNQKLWTIPPDQLTLDWMGNYVPRPDVPRVLQGAFVDMPEAGGYNASFLYPRHAGIGQLAEALASHLTNLHLNTVAITIDPRQRRLTTTSETLSWKNLISTLALPALVSKLIRPPQKIVEAGRHLRATSVLAIHFGVHRTSVHPAHWLYFPEKKYVFYRVGFPSNYGHVAPKGYSAVCAEIALSPTVGPQVRAGLIQRARQDLQVAGILRPEDQIVLEHAQYIRHAYVIFDGQHQQARKIILEYLDHCGIQSIGRWGGWEYSAMEDALLAGQAAAQRLLPSPPPRRRSGKKHG